MSILLPGMDEALVYLMHVDNTGAQTPAQAITGWEATKRLYPNAKLHLSSLGEFATVLGAARTSGNVGPSALPIVTDVEAGSTWIFGLASTPRKFRRYRAAARVRAAATRAGGSVVSDARFQEFSRLLLKIPEHTAGYNGAGCNGAPWADSQWTNPQYGCRVGGPDFVKNRDSFLDQTNFVDRAVTALDGLPGTFQDDVRSELQASEPLPSAAAATAAWNPPSLMRPYTVGTSVVVGAVGGGANGPQYRVRFNASGALVELSSVSLPRTGEDAVVAAGEATAVVDDTHPLGLLSYRTHSEEELNSFRDQYSLRGCGEACGACGFGKCDLHKDGATSTRTLPTVTAATMDAATGRFFFNMSFRHPGWSCPQFATLAVVISNNKTSTTAADSSADSSAASSSSSSSSSSITPASTMVAFDLQLWDKPPTRMAESLWFSFRPRVPNRGAQGESLWRMDKMGRWVDPLNTVLNGSQTLHGVWYGVRHRSPSSSSSAASYDVDIETLDAPLVSPGSLEPAGAFNFPNGTTWPGWPAGTTYDSPDGRARPDMGWHFNLFNNAWSTNYALWSLDEAMRFRWNVRLAGV